MDVDLEKLMDGVWNLWLDRISKKELPAVRPSLGDDIDLYVPQTRTLLMVEANPDVASLIYNSSYISANRNAYIITKKLGMPADYFWKFEYWLKTRAFDTLQRVINRIFSAMLSQNKEGSLELEDVNIDLMRFTVSFRDCAECAGITAEKSICYYHAATFSGIIAALINKDMDGFETKCQAKGDDACTFLIGRRDDPEISVKVSESLALTKMEIKSDERLSSCLQGNPLRSIGNLVNVGYYHLMITHSIITDPALFSSSSFDVGVEHGTKLASIITDFYQEDGIEVLRKYYNQLRHLDVKTIEMGENIDIVLAECAEVVAMLKSKELLGFLFGELQGLVSALLNQRVVYKESWFEDNTVKVRLLPQV